MVRCHFYLLIMNSMWILATTDGSAFPVPVKWCEDLNGI